MFEVVINIVMTSVVIFVFIMLSLDPLDNFGIPDWLKCILAVIWPVSFLVIFVGSIALIWLR